MYSYTVWISINLEEFRKNLRTKSFNLLLYSLDSLPGSLVSLVSNVDSPVEVSRMYTLI